MCSQAEDGQSALSNGYQQIFPRPQPCGKQSCSRKSRAGSLLKNPPLAKEKEVYSKIRIGSFIKDPKNQPNLEKYKNIIEKQLRPKARGDIIDHFLKNDVIPNSMIDISDGLSSDLMHLSDSSNLGFKIFEEK